MTTATMTRKELMDNELNLVNGGEDAGDISIEELIRKYDPAWPIDPLYDPDHDVPWVIDRQVFGEPIQIPGLLKHA